LRDCGVLVGLVEGVLDGGWGNTGASQTGNPSISPWQTAIASCKLSGYVACLMLLH